MDAAMVLAVLKSKYGRLQLHSTNVGGSVTGMMKLLPTMAWELLLSLRFKNKNRSG